jgi:hypothetical protein
LYIYTGICGLREKLETKEIPSLIKKRIKMRMIKERIRIKKSLFLNWIYIDLVAIRATLRELIRIIIYYILFLVYYTCITYVLHM